MKKIALLLFSLISSISLAQKLNTADEVIDKYLTVCKIKGNAEKITDMTMSYTSETPRGVSEAEFKFLFPSKNSMTIFSNGLEIMSMKYDGQKLERKSNWGGQNQPAKTGYEAKVEAAKMSPFVELNYKNLQLTPKLLNSETIEGAYYYVLEVSDSTGKKWKDFYNAKTGFKTKSTFVNESPKGKFEGQIIFDEYKAFKGSEILFSSIKKQTSPMGEISSELQNVKFNKGLKDKDFEIK